MVVGLDVVLADGRHGAHRRRATRRGRARPHPAVRRQRGHARRDHRRPPARPSGAGRRGAGGVPVHVASPPASTRAAASSDRGATPAVLRLYDAIEAERHFSTGDAHVLLVLDEGDPTLVDAALAVVARGVHATRRRTTPRWSTCGSSTATTSPRSSTSSAPASSSTRWRSRRAWSALPDDLRRRARPRSGRVDGTLRGVGAPVATRTPTAPASTSPSPAIRRWTNVSRTTAPRGTPARRRRWPAARALSHHHGVGLNRARFVARRARRGVRRAGRDQAARSTRTAS